MKSLKYIVICLSLFSCKSQQIDSQKKASHLMLKKALYETYKNKKDKTINFEIYTRNVYQVNFEDFIHNIKIDTKVDTTWFNDFSNFEKLHSDNKFDKWNSKKIKIKNLNTQFEITQKDNQRHLKEMIERDSLNYRKAYEMKVVFWVKENGTYDILSAASPVFSSNGKKAILITSVYHQGITAWLFDKIDGVWKLKFRKEVAIY